MEADLGRLFDAVAEQHGLVCKICEPLSEGRSYGGQTEAEKTVAVTVNFEPLQGHIYYDLRAPASATPVQQQELAAIRTEIQQALHTDFPQLQIVAVAPASANPVRLGVKKARRATSYLEHENQEDYKRTLAIVDKVARNFDLTRAHPAMYYAGKLLGPNEYERELAISVVLAEDPLIAVRVDAHSAQYADLQQQIVRELQQQLRNEFGSQRVLGAD